MTRLKRILALSLTLAAMAVAVWVGLVLLAAGLVAGGLLALALRLGAGRHWRIVAVTAPPRAHSFREWRAESVL